MSTTAIAITWEVFHDGEFIGDVHLISKGLHWINSFSNVPWEPTQWQRQLLLTDCFG